MTIAIAKWHQKRAKSKAADSDPEAAATSTPTNPSDDIELARAASTASAASFLQPLAKAPPYISENSVILSKLSTSSNKTKRTRSKQSSMSEMKPATRPPHSIDPFMSWISDHIKSNPTTLSLRSQYEITFSDISIDTAIGEGSFGRVYSATWSGQPVAVKVLMDTTSGRITDPLIANSTSSASAPIMTKLAAEVNIMSTMHHPNIVKFIGVCSVPPCIVTELCARGSLADVIKEASASPEAAANLGWTRRIAMAIDAAEGLQYLHSQSPPIVHRDMKSANMLVTQDHQVKISDFNLSKILDDSTRSSSLGAMNPRWIALEIFDGKSATPACDVFAFGVVLWELLTLQVPWGSANPWHIVNSLRTGGRLPFPAREEMLGGAPSGPVYDRFINLINRCWAQAPEDRPTIGDVASELW